MVDYRPANSVFAIQQAVRIGDPDLGDRWGCTGGREWDETGLHGKE